MKKVIKAMSDALKVLTRDPKILAWLKENDPKALDQALEALELEAKENYEVLCRR